MSIYKPVVRYSLTNGTAFLSQLYNWFNIYLPYNHLLISLKNYSAPSIYAS